MEIITNRYRRETGLSPYKHNWYGKRLHNQKYIDWLEKQVTEKTIHKAKVLTKDEVENNRSSAYEYINLK